MRVLYVEVLGDFLKVGDQKKIGRTSTNLQLHACMPKSMKILVYSSRIVLNIKTSRSIYIVLGLAEDEGQRTLDSPFDPRS